MSRSRPKTHVETLAWITDDEAEFWTSITPVPEDEPKSKSRKSEESSSNSNLPDGFHFKFDSSPDKQSENNENQNKQTSEISPDKKGSTKATSEKSLPTKQTDENKQEPTNISNSNEDVSSKTKEEPQVDMNFVDRLVKKILRPLSSKSQNSFDEEQYTEIDSSGIKEDKDKNDLKPQNDKNNLINDTNVLDKGRVFIDELTEEIDVIRGNLDEETFINRRSRQAKSSISSIKDQDRLVPQKSI